jgi:two-component system cell cycle sensor histidine kinase/response regulator CckA
MKNKKSAEKKPLFASKEGEKAISLWFESFPEAVCLITPEGIILQVNEAFALWFSKTCDEFIASDIFDLLPAELHEQRKNFLDAVRGSLKPISWENERNGRNLRTSIYPALTAEGNLDYFVIVSQDVTTFIRSENMHAVSNKRLQLIMAEAHAGSWEWELGTNANIWSDELWALYGIEKNSCEPSFDRWCQTVIPEDRAQAKEAVLHAVKLNTEFTVEWRVCHADGSLRWLMAKGVPYCGADGRVSRYIGIVIDITERMEAERKLRKSGLLFRQLFDGHSAVQLIIDPDSGGILDANQEAAAFYGWEIEQLKKKSILEINTRASEEVLDELKQCKSSRKQRVLCRHRRADSSVRDVELFSTIIEIGGKELLYSIVLDVTERMFTQKLLSESNARYHSLFKHILNAIAYCRLIFEDGKAVDFIFEEVNPQFEKLTGLKNVEGRKVSEIISGIHESSPELFQLYERVATTGEPERYELFLKTLMKWFDMSVYSHKQGCCVAVFDNITERKRIESDQKQSEVRFRKMFEGHSAVMIIIDPDNGNIVDANQAAADFYGWPIQALTQMQIQQITNVSAQAVKENIEKIKSSFQNKFLFRHRRADGSVRDVEVYSKSIEISGKDLLYTIVHDVTERMHLEALTEFRHILLECEDSFSMEEILQTSLDEIERMTGSSIGFCYFLNEDQSALIIQAMSTSTKEHMGWIDDNKTHFPLFDAGVWADAVRDRRAVIHNDADLQSYCIGMPENHIEVKRQLVTPVMKGESVVALFGVGNKTGDYNKDDARYASSIADIAWNIVTRRTAKQSEKKMQEALIQSQKLELVGQLAGGIAHDFNNMLTVILGHTEIALQATGSSHNNLLAIQKAASHSADLTRKLLAFARKQSIMPKILDLNETVQGMLSMLHHLIGEHITLSWVPTKSDVQIRFDPSQIDQILVNLCINARDAITGTGNITIETNHIHVDSAESAAGHPCIIPGDYITLFVTDTGQGIDKRYRAHIFEPFFTTKEVGKGTGMGLSTVYGIVKQNRGYIDFQSETGNGTSFRIFLPWCNSESTSTSSRIPEPAHSESRVVVLLVEDQLNILHLYRQILEQKGYIVLAASNPDEAIRLAGQGKVLIDLLVTDVIMPGMNGCELFKNLQMFYPSLKVLYMSGYPADFISRYTDMGEDVNFIEKPFTTSIFTAKLQEIVNSHNHNQG